MNNDLLMQKKDKEVCLFRFLSPAMVIIELHLFRYLSYVDIETRIVWLAT